MSPTPFWTDYDRVHEVALVNLMSHNVQQTVDHLTPTAAFVATTTGRTARLIARFKLPVWLVAVCENAKVCQGLQFSYGVLPLLVAQPPTDWNAFATRWSHAQQVPLGNVVLAQGPSARHPAANHRLSIMDLCHSAPAVVS
jgi:pyruvate kinase